MPRPSKAAAAILACCAPLLFAPFADAKKRRKPPPAGTAAKPIRLAAVGKQPDVLVDLDGTAHVVWTREGGDAGPDVLAYCRLPRGARTCRSTAALFPDQPGANNSPAFNEDFDGPRVLRVGGQLVLLTHRYPNAVPKPDGSSDSNSTYAWTSADGGNTFQGPQLIGASSISGGAAALGSVIGVVSDTKTGGTFFAALGLGGYSGREANLAVGPDQAYDGSLAAAGGRFIAAFADLTGHVIVRRGPAPGGDPNDPAQWSQQTIAGQDPRVAGGPGGVFLMQRPAGFRKPFQVRKVGANSVGSATRLGPGGDQPSNDLFEDPTGARLYATWVTRVAPRARLTLRTSPTGARWPRAFTLARGGYGMGDVEVSGTRKNGVAVYSVTSSGREGSVYAVPFKLR
jgi:hypothetical protein